MRVLPAAVAVLALVGGLAALPVTEVTRASSVAADPTTYQVYGRVFPDPQGCLPDGPGVSPWRKGNVCAADFLGWDEALAGLGFLEDRFDRYLDVVNLREDAAGWPGLDGLDLQSAGLVRTDLTRERSDLYAVHVTDELSSVPMADRRHFAMMLSIHGDERPPVEGGLRVVEDLVTWAACEQDGAAAPACATEGPFPKQILEPTDTGPTAGSLLEDSVIVFLLGNPDGWVRGDVSEAGTLSNRGNGHGADLNRDWPVRGYVEPIHTPWSEPETVGFGRYLEVLRDRTSAGRFEGGVDVHGVVATAHALSLTLLIVDEQDYAESRRVRDVAAATFADAELRVAWSPHVAPAGDCPGPVPEPSFGRTFVPMCTDQWGTVWDTVGYNATGGTMAWGGSPLGLDATAVANEMADLTSPFAPQLRSAAFQLLVDGTKGLLFTELTELSAPKVATFPVEGRVAYVADPTRTSHPGTPEPPNGSAQEDRVIDDLTGTDPIEFTVEEGNGGLAVDIRYTNVHGTTVQDHVVPVVQRCRQDSCEDVAVYVPFSGQGHAGIRLSVNRPAAGHYRVVHRWHPTVADRAGTLTATPPPARYHVTFTDGKAYPEPEQLAYDVSRLDLFGDINEYVDGVPLQPVPLDRITKAPGFIRRFDTLVIADGPLPTDSGDRADVAARLRDWVGDGGTLVLTDGALAMLDDLAGLDAGAVSQGFFSTGWMDFDDGAGPTYDRPLARGVDQPGAARGLVAPGEAGPFDDARETYTGPPLGFFVSPQRFGNAVCDTDRCDAPVWVVDQAAWEDAGGTTVARTFVRLADEPLADGIPARSTVGVSLGELGVGAGRIRIAGALLPEPTDAHHHPYGLSAYAVTPTGYQLLENLLALP